MAGELLVAQAPRAHALSGNATLTKQTDPRERAERTAVTVQIFTDCARDRKVWFATKSCDTLITTGLYLPGLPQQAARFEGRSSLCVRSADGHHL